MEEEEGNKTNSGWSAEERARPAFLVPAVRAAGSPVPALPKACIRLSPPHRSHGPGASAGLAGGHRLAR